MDDLGSLSHSKWECTYHVVFIPKYRRRVLLGQLWKELGRVLVELARQKECTIHKGSIQSDHVHMEISIPPKSAVSQVIGYVKGKSAIGIARTYGGRKRHIVGEHFWARGYYVSTVGKDEAVIRAYIERQSHEDQRLDQLRFEQE